MPAKRPGVVTFIGVILYIQAILALVAGIVVIAFRKSDTILDVTAQSSTTLLATGIVELVIGALIFLVAWALMGGSKGARLLIAAVMTIRMGAAVWLMLTHHTTAYVELAVVYILIGFFVLWALYGNEKAEAYFEQYG